MQQWYAYTFKRDILILFCHILSFLYSGSQFIPLRTPSTAPALHISIFRLLNIPRTSGERGREMYQEAVEQSYTLQVWKGWEHIWGSPHLFLQPSLKATCFLSILIATHWQAWMFCCWYPPPQNYSPLFLTVSLWKLSVSVAAFSFLVVFSHSSLVSFTLCLIVSALPVLLWRIWAAGRGCLSFRLEQHFCKAQRPRFSVNH